MKNCTWTGVLFSLILVATSQLVCENGICSELVPGRVVELSYPNDDLPPTLHSMWTGEVSPPGITVRLPASYDKSRKYPLLVYVPGYHGHAKGNIEVAIDIAGERECIVVSVPLFKRSIDRSEPAGGVIVSHQDYPCLSRAYSTMLGQLLEQVPNTDPEKSALVGFSNGAIAIAVLVSAHDEFVLNHFRNFCLVDHGMFHLVDLHKQGARDSRFLILAGDQSDFGRELKIRQGQLQQDAAKALGVNLRFQILQDTGHEFEPRHRAIVGEWLSGEAMGNKPDK